MDHLQLRHHIPELMRASRLAVAAARALGDRSAEIQSHCHLGAAYTEAESYDEAAACYLTATTIAQETGDQSHALTIFMGLGNMALRAGRYDHAITCYQRALQLSPNEPATVAALVNLGSVLRLMRPPELPGDLRLDPDDPALAYLLAARKLVRGARDITEQAVLLNLGTQFMSYRRMDEAMDCLAESLAICRELDEPYQEGLLLLVLSEAHVLLELIPEATADLEQAVVAFESVGAVEGIERARVRLARLR